MAGTHLPSTRRPLALTHDAHGRRVLVNRPAWRSPGGAASGDWSVSAPHEKNPDSRQTTYFLGGRGRHLHAWAGQCSMHDIHELPILYETTA